ncbi:monalysin family beta-barrel pore-forming toxin [Pseudomonas vranovensis]|uniref:monalysin family beta-barrel pore-forming toxin n=1 Tax=Pseudomonas vranovensis TaxID=321661 RepID=UPI003D972C1D
MSIQELVKESQSYPRLSGSYDIDRYLVGEAQLKTACWVRGQTVYGDIMLMGEKRKAYTVPVMAQLVHVDTIRLPSNVEQQHDVQISKGMSRSFSASVQASFSISSGAGLVNATSELQVGFSVEETWASSTSERQALLLKGPGTFFIYQVHLIYAHVAIGAAPSVKDAFEFHRVHDDNLYFFSSVATKTIVPVSKEDAIRPLSWREVNHIGLVEGYDPEFNSGRWAIVYAARDNAHQRY